MSRRDDHLSDDDRILWNLVARSARPLKRKAAVEIPEIIEPKPTPAAASVN
ncbi:MAG: DNA mismatch repair protein MutS, partial [Mesorhizobium sp.]